MKYIGYVGTYTKGESEGIYSFTLDTKKAIISELKVAATLDNPTYLHVGQNNLYSVVKEGESGGVASFSVDRKSGELTPLNRQVTPGSPPCHLSADVQNQFLFSANYHKGTVESYLIKDGQIQPRADVAHHEGSGPDPRQEKPHTHFAALTPDEKFLVVAELGSDQLNTYQVGEDGKLTSVHRLAVRPGSGPRHLAFHPNEKYAYLLTELSSEIIALHYKAEDGKFVPFQILSAIPDDFQENNQASAIHMSKDGQFLYTANRGHNSIAVFRVHPETGELQWLEHVSTEGDWPRDFALDPSEKFIVASNQNSNNLVLFARDSETGKLTRLHSDVSVPDPVCVKFLPSTDE
ncbi:lactonase family protein [Ammoniphilus resinae]|uniref:6-phosphogluconolactonase n=1 Tax=Ammoniphilus resinae TaxID=861532 RepID=A0ABS4GLU2_9BACL|nr:lactonase family protein [Ammoniphilus resinae]MBP1931077.1 6-phosphogluconolactonase [Ammoniphilus resinae]